MASKKDILPVNADTEIEQSSSITYAPEVINIITSAAVNEVEGIAGMSSVSGGLLTRKGNISKGIKIELGPEEVSIDLYVIVEYDRPIQRVAQEVQENVRKAIENQNTIAIKLTKQLYDELKQGEQSIFGLDADVNEYVKATFAHISQTVKQKYGEPYVSIYQMKSE